MSKEQVYRIANAINSIYNENIYCANEEMAIEVQAYDEFYNKYFSVLNTDRGRNKFTYFLEQCEKIMKKSEIRKEILDYVSSSCIEYDDENYNVVVKIHDDLPHIKDVLLYHTKTIIRRIVDKEKLVLKVLKDCNTTYLSPEALAFVVKKFGKEYALYELLLILMNYFIDKKNMHINTAIESSLRILKMLYGEGFNEIFDNENLPYGEFYSYLVEPFVENLSFDKEILKTLEDVYSKI